jgi:hypothetical protein
LNILEAQKTIDRAIRLAERFEKESEQVLGVYTQRVDDYVDVTQDATTWRYDAALITRGKLEYHLGMLGTEILNRAYRQRFLDTDRRLVIVPNCLPKQPEGQCKAVRTPMGSVCQGCTPGCRVYQITQMGKKQGIPVVIIPDDELARICVSSGQAGTGMGVVGLSCALTNWSAGWDAERLGLHAQGVLLDCAGCKKHWTREGVSTDANLKKIKEVLGVAE